MEERKTAAIVLGILALIVVFFTAVLPEIRDRSTQTIAFKNCSVQFRDDERGASPDIYRAAQNKLALCLCTSYQQKPDTIVGNHIIQIYKEYGSHDSIPFNNIDSIIKHKSKVLDTLVLLD